MRKLLICLLFALGVLVCAAPAVAQTTLDDVPYTTPMWSAGDPFGLAELRSGTNRLYQLELRTNDLNTAYGWGDWGPRVSLLEGMTNLINSALQEETDTLQSVTARGNTTTSAITITPGAAFAANALFIDASNTSIDTAAVFGVRVPANGAGTAFSLLRGASNIGWAAFGWNVGGTGNPGLGLGSGAIARDTLIYRAAAATLGVTSNIVALGTVTAPSFHGSGTNLTGVVKPADLPGLTNAIPSWITAAIMAAIMQPGEFYLGTNATINVATNFVCFRANVTSTWELAVDAGTPRYPRDLVIIGTNGSIIPSYIVDNRQGPAAATNLYYLRPLGPEPSTNWWFQ